MAVLAAIALGCEGSKPPAGSPDAATTVDGPAPIDGPEPIGGPAMDAPATMIVRGTSTLHRVTDTGIIDRPQDFSGQTISSFTPTASGFERRAGEGAADGTFSLPVGAGAPAWQVELGSFPGAPRDFIVSSAPRLDLSAFRLGRPDRQFPSLTTAVTLNATGLAPWTLVDEIGIISPNVGAIVLGDEAGAALVAGDTAITNHVIDWPSALIEAARGDTTMMYQLVSKTPATGFPGFYIALAKSGMASGFTMRNGAPATMTVALADVPQTRTLAVHVKRSQFDALRAQVGPGALASELFEQSILIRALPQLSQRGYFAVSPILVLALPDAGALDYDQTFSYGNPFTTGGVAWEEFAQLRYSFSVPVLAAGATIPFKLDVGLRGRVPIAALAADGTIAPALTPVRNVKIAGGSLAKPQTGVGLTPTITWEAPSMGAPTSYLVTVHRVTANGTTTTVLSIATFTTTSTSLQLPDAVLASGASYLLTIEANAVPDYDPAAPFTSAGLANFFTTSATAQFTP